MGKSVTAQALASQGAARSGLGGQGGGNQALDQAAVALPLAAGGSARRSTGTVKTAAAPTTALKAPAKAVAKTAKGAANKPGALKGSRARTSSGLKTTKTVQALADQARTERRRMAEQSDVLVSAVISTYLLTHLHHVLQRAEFGAQQEGRAAPSRQLRPTAQGVLPRRPHHGRRLRQRPTRGLPPGRLRTGLIPGSGSSARAQAGSNSCC